MTIENGLQRLEEITREATDLIKNLRQNLDPEKVRRAGVTPGKPDFSAKEKGIIWNAVWSEPFEGQFTVRDVRRTIRKNLKKKHWESSYVSPCLAEWAAEGYLHIVSKGSGRRPSVYEIPRPIEGQKGA